MSRGQFAHGRNRGFEATGVVAGTAGVSLHPGEATALRDEGLRIDSRRNTASEIRQPPLRPTLLKPAASSGRNVDCNFRAWDLADAVAPHVHFAFPAVAGAIENSGHAQAAKQRGVQ
jgi:hypothetical protein